MKRSKKSVAILILLVMLICDLAFPIKNIVYAGQGDVEQNINYANIEFKGENLVLEEDGSVSMDCNLEYNEGRINFSLYNQDNTHVRITQRYEYDEELEQNVPIKNNAEGILNTESRTGAYLIVTSKDVNFDDIVFDFGLDEKIEVKDVQTNVETGEKTGRIDIVWEHNEWIMVIDTEYTIMHKNEKKEVYFTSEDLQVNNGIATIKCDLEYNEGTIDVALFNSDNSKAEIKRSIYWEELKDEDGNYILDEYGNVVSANVESPTNASAKLKTSIYDGAYLVVSSSDKVNISDIKFVMGYDNNTYEEICVAPDAEGRVYFPNNLPEYNSITIDTRNLRAVNEKKELFINNDNLSIDGNTVTIDSKLEFNPGKLIISIFNEDGTEAIIKRDTSWQQKLDEEGKPVLDDQGNEIWEEVVSNTSARALFKKTTYEGAYLMVESEGVDLTDLRFEFAGHGVMADENGRVDLPGDVQWLNLSPDTLHYKNPRAEMYVQSEDDLGFNEDGSISIKCNVENNSGIVKMYVYNQDDSLVKFEKGFYWDEEKDDLVESNKSAFGHFKTDTIKTGYIVFKSDEVDLTKIAVDILNTRKLIGENGRVDLDVELDSSYVADYLYFSQDSFHNGENRNVSITVKGINGIGEMYINGTFLEKYVKEEDIDEENGVVTIKDIPIEAKENDTIELGTGYGYKISEIKVNGEKIDLSEDSSYWTSFSIPRKDEYVFEIKTEIDENIPAEVYWTYAEDYSDKCVKNGKIEIVSVTIPGEEGEEDLVWDEEEISKIEDTPGIGEHHLHEEAKLWYSRDRDGNIIGGNLETKRGAIVKAKIIPDYGYQFKSDSIKEIELVADENEPYTYTFVMPDSFFEFGDIMEKTEDDVDCTETEVVDQADVELSEDEEISGTVRLTVKDIEPEEEEKEKFETKATESGYTISTYLKIDLNQIIYKDSSESWESKVVLSKPVTITLTLAGGIDGDNVVVIHNINNSGEYEVITPESYDSITRKLVFKVSNFSDFAIAYKDTGETQNYNVWVNGEQFTSKNKTINCDEGTATFDPVKNKLTLNNAKITKSYEFQPWYEAMIYSSLPKLTIELVGTNTLTDNSNADGIDSSAGCDITIEGTGTLNINGAYYGTYIGEYSVADGSLTIKDATVNINNTSCAGIWANKDINFENATVNVMRTGTSYNGIVSNIDGTITVTDSNVTVENVKNAIHFGNSDESSHSLVLNSGKLTVKATDGYGIFVQPYEDSEGNNVINGNIKINGGTLEVESTEAGTNVPEEKIILEARMIYTTGESLKNSGRVVIEQFFKDIVPGAWYLNSIKYVVSNGLMNGYTGETDSGKFGPEDQITRGQIVTILYRRENSPDASEIDMKFDDVGPYYYYDAIKWASQNGIVTGHTAGENAGKFMPDDPITREQLAVILQRYAKYKNISVEDAGDLTGFKDYEQVSPWALEGLKWVVSKGIITGDLSTTPPSINPQGNATRAQAATMIMRFCENVK